MAMIGLFRMNIGEPQRLLERADEWLFGNSHIASDRKLRNGFRINPIRK